MFDVSFFELLVVAVVGLIVIGPERLPGTVRTCALWVGRIKRSLAETRQELEKHIGADEIRRELHNEQVLRNLEKMKDTRLELEAKIRQLETGTFLTGEESTSSTPNNTQELQTTAAESQSRSANYSSPETQESDMDHTPKH